jgi:hypothetical protein
MVESQVIEAAQVLLAEIDVPSYCSDAYGGSISVYLHVEIRMYTQS